MGCCESQMRHERPYNQNRRAQNKPEAPQKDQNGQRPEKGAVEVSRNIKRKKKAKNPREHLQPFADQSEDFLTHHLKYQLSLTKLTNMKKIRRRQIIEHLWLQTLWGNIGGLKQLKINYHTFQQSLISAWIQRTFLDIWHQSHEELFVKSEDLKVIRRKVAEQFMFQLYELKQYVDSGMSVLNFMLQITRTQLNNYVQVSDDALYNLFKNLNAKYPQTAVKGNLKVPEIQTTKTNVNLLDHFPAKCFSDPKNMNYQTIYEDVRFMLQKAIDQQENFKNDMKDLLGEDVLTCPKVNQVTKDGKTSFNACAVRRVFVKWAENLLDKCPDLKKTKVFMSFIRSKGDIVNGFFFKSTIRPTTHKAVIDCLSMLIELAKYDLNTHQRRKQFTFNIYDLLRCKVKRKTPQQVVSLFQKLEKTSKTKSGKLFKVIRAKNRFETNNRDVLVNFRYGDVLVAEAQIGVDIIEEQTLSKQAKLNNAVSHFFYELERSIFGPTLELMMQYEDNQRPDITVTFEAEGQVSPRTNEVIESAKSTKRKCLHGHQMVSLRGNYFTKGNTQNQSSQQVIKMPIQTLCNYCDRKSTVQYEYDYCYQCGCYLCRDCRKDYEKLNLKNVLTSIERQDLLPQINNFNQLSDFCSRYKSAIILFWLDGSSASVLFKDSMILHQAKIKMQPKQFVPKIGQVKYSIKPGIQDIIQRLGITEFPTLILFDKNTIPFKTILGFSWFQTPVLYALQKHILQNKNLQQISLNCSKCDTRMVAEQIRQESQQCINCFDHSKTDYLPQQVVQYGSYCQNDHYRCMNCCYAILNCPSVYKDFLGSNYLSTTFVNPRLSDCPNGHQTKLFKGDPQKNWEYTCWNCQEKYYFDNQHGVGVCTEGQSSLCAQCMGAKITTFSDLTHQFNLASHLSESSAEQIPFCNCDRPFKKVYTSRMLSKQQQKEEGSWQCAMCERQKTKKELHLACFACPAFSEIQEEKVSLQLCMRCANRSKMTVCQENQKIEEVQCLEQCPVDSSSLFFTSRQKHGKLTFSCYFCRKLYFGNSQRYYCSTCNMNCCEDCKQRLWQKNPPTCKQRCNEGHQLTYMVVKRQGLQFCDGCMAIIPDEAFVCSEDDYKLCETCVEQKPADFVGDVSQLAKLNDQGEHESEEYSEDYSDIGQTFHGYQQQGQGQDQQESSSEEWDDEYDEEYEDEDDYD